MYTLQGGLKMKKSKCIYLVLTLMFILILSPKVLAEENKEIEKALIDQLGDDYEKKLELNQKAADNATKIEKYFSKKRNGEIKYPNYIGGLYINKNNNLVVQFVESAIPAENDKQYNNYQAIKNVSEDIDIEFVSYSYLDLQEIHDIILDYYLNKNENKNIVGLHIDVEKNSVIVNFREYNDEVINYFKENVINSPAVVFDKGEVYSVVSDSNNEKDNDTIKVTDINPGAGFTIIGNNEKKSDCSVGYRARLTSDPKRIGFVTAAHCFNAKGNTSTIYSLPNIGKVTKFQFDEDLDAAWVETFDNINPTNKFEYEQTFNPNILSQRDGDYVSTEIDKRHLQGRYVAKLGTSSMITIGEISWPSDTITFVHKDKDGNEIESVLKDVVLVNGSNGGAAPGDSGGVVVQVQYGDFINKYPTNGIVAASNNGTSYYAYIKATNINNAFGLERY